MALKAAIVMSIISIIMLAIYGSDVVAAGPNADEGGKTGFLSMSASTRGTIFGIVPSAMLIASFFITRKEPSNLLGGLIMAGGAMIVVGTGVILAMQAGQVQDSRAIREFGAVLGIGIIIMILGGLKVKRSRKQSAQA